MSMVERKKEAPKIQKLRGSHKFRLGLIFVLMVIVAVMFFFFEKFRIALVIIFIALLTVFGLEVSKNDWNLQELWETKSFQESKVSRDTQGNILFDKLGNITTDKTLGKKADDYNCDDFLTQPEAQAFFENVGGVGNDVNRLDGNKDGEACESLPKGIR
jgi:ABC-type multidrug transport system fused ATPase/permease subunit